jgi:hypothetical protein
MHEDPQFRRRCHAYIAGLTCVAVMPLVCNSLSGVPHVLFLGLALAGLLGGVAVLALRHQQFMNVRIADALRDTLAQPSAPTNSGMSLGSKMDLPARGG